MPSRLGMEVGLHDDVGQVPRVALQGRRNFAEMRRAWAARRRAR